MLSIFFSVSGGAEHARRRILHLANGALALSGLVPITKVLAGDFREFGKAFDNIGMLISHVVFGADVLHHVEQQQLARIVLLFGKMRVIAKALQGKEQFPRPRTHGPERTAWS
jgi:hypothetical protein